MKDVICECGHEAGKHQGRMGCFGPPSADEYAYCGRELTESEVLRAHIAKLEAAARAFIKNFPDSVLQDTDDYNDGSDAPVMDFCFPTMGEVRDLTKLLK